MYQQSYHAHWLQSGTYQPHVCISMHAHPHRPPAPPCFVSSDVFFMLTLCSALGTSCGFPPYTARPSPLRMFLWANIVFIFQLNFYTFVFFFPPFFFWGVAILSHTVSLCAVLSSLLSLSWKNASRLFCFGPKLKPWFNKSQENENQGYTSDRNIIRIKTSPSVISKSWSFFGKGKICEKKSALLWSTVALQRGSGLLILFCKTCLLKRNIPN